MQLSARVHSSTWRGLVDKIILVEGALSFSLHSASYARPAQGNVAARSHLPRSLPPCHPLRLAMCSQPRPPSPVPSALRPRTPTRSLSAHRCANFSQHLLHAAERMLLSAFAGRLRDDFRARTASWALWSPTIHAACGDARLAARGERGEERGRDTRAIGWAPRGQFFFMLVHSYLGTPLGSRSDLGRFGDV